MATSPGPVSTHPVADSREVRIYSHSNLFYWWPVWVCGFIMAIWTVIDGHRLAIVPADTKLEQVGDNYVLQTKGKLSPDHPFERVARNSRLAVIFVVILLLVILITSVPLRGLWSVVVIITIVLMAIILALADWWDKIFESIGNLHMHANLAFYIVMSTSLLIMWLISVFFFDRQTYMIFTPSQLARLYGNRVRGNGLRYDGHDDREAPLRLVPALDSGSGIGGSDYSHEWSAGAHVRDAQRA